MSKFGLLGTLVIEDGGLTVPVEATKPRVVLATLLLHANQPVTVERLVDVLWDDRPPASARVTVQGHVKRLRQTLGPGLAGRITTTTAGYVMRLDDGELDCHAVTALYERARFAAAVGDPASAVEALGEAQRLWRGEPLLDIPSPVLQREHVPALTELYAELIEFYVAVQLTLGRHADLVPELRGLVAQHPLRERLYGYLMKALHLSGRTVEALDVFRQARVRLVAEAGVEPGAELQVLQRSILAETVPLSTGGPAQPVSERPACQLPADIADFTGRQAEILRLTELIDAVPGPPVLVICGASGIGKSVLAVHVAHRWRARFADGQLYLPLHGSGRRPMPTGEALAWLLRSVGIHGAAIPADAEERAALLRSALADRRMLILLDDAATAAQVRPLIPGTSSCAVVVTSRSRMAGLEGAVRLELPVMRPREAHALLVSIASVHRVGSDPAAVNTVIRLCGRLPLALRVAASRFAGRPEWSLGDLAERLRIPGQRLDELVAGDLSVRATLNMAYQALPEPQAQMFALLAASDVTDLSLLGVASLCGMPQGMAETVVEALVDLHLLDSPGPGRYRHHDLLRLFAEEMLARMGSHPRSAAVDRLHLAYWQALQGVATRPMTEGTATSPTPRFASHDEARAWLEREHPVLVTIIVEASARGPAGLRLAADMLGAVRSFLRSTGRWDEWERATRAVLDAATAAADLTADLAARQHLGMLEMLRGRLDEAEDALTRSLEMARCLDDRATEAYVFNRLGFVADARGRRAMALDLHENAFRIFAEIGDVRGQAITLTNVARMRTALDDPAGGLDAVRLGLELSRRIGDEELAVMFLHQRANALTRLGRLQKAIRDHRRCLALSQQNGLREGAAFALAELGQTYLAAGRVNEATQCLQMAVDRFRLLGNPLAAGTYLIVLGSGWLSCGRKADAAAAWRTARQLLNPSDPPAVAKVDALLALVARRKTPVAVSQATPQAPPRALNG